MGAIGDITVLFWQHVHGHQLERDLSTVTKKGEQRSAGQLDRHSQLLDRADKARMSCHWTLPRHHVDQPDRDTFQHRSPWRASRRRWPSLG
jgi:hypothetical protein